jgi:hypothetical protein
MAEEEDLLENARAYPPNYRFERVKTGQAVFGVSTSNHSTTQ